MQKIVKGNVYMVDGAWLFRIEEDFGADATEAGAATIFFYDITARSVENSHPVEGEFLFKLFRKWDGCNHFWFGDETSYLHHDDVKMLARSLIVAAWVVDVLIDQNAAQGRDPDEGWLEPKNSYMIEKIDETDLFLTDLQ